MSVSDDQRERMLIEEQIERVAVEAGPSGSKLENSPTHRQQTTLASSAMRRQRKSPYP